MKKIKSISSRLLAEEALRRGIKVKHINDYQEEFAFLELSCKDHLEYIMGTNISRTSCTANYALRNKALTKSLLGKKGISLVPGRLFNKKNINEMRNYIKAIKYPLVVKKHDGAHGDSVFIGINNQKQCDEKTKKILTKNNYVLVEKEFKGKEYRIIASREKVFAALLREPANVVGDGIHSIKELVKIKNSDPMRGEGYEKPLMKIKINIIVKRNLEDQGKNQNVIPSRGEKIFLRKNSNISTGGDCIDVTDEIHPYFKEIAIRTVRAISGLAYAGVDIMTSRDIHQKPSRSSYSVLELNSAPSIDIHHFPYKGKSRNVAKEIIDILFPETKTWTHQV